jgi:triosephosphate isomerase
MNKPHRKIQNTIATVCRVVLGGAFVFSGFTKIIDPWGTALQISEYFSVWGFGTLGDVRFVLAIGLCAAELVLGLMLVSGVKTRLTSIAAVVVMACFLVVTFLSATLLPVADCGCFGEAVHLSPWASFGKNVVLTGLAVVVWWNARDRLKILPITVREWLVTAIFAVMAVGVGVWCLRHLPLIDFLPYKTGVDLRAATQGDADSDLRLREFILFSDEDIVTDKVLEYTGRVYMICALKLDDIGPRCEARLAEVAGRAQKESALVVCLTSSPIPEGGVVRFGESAPVAVYNLDPSTMLTMLRAKTGVVILDNGVIVAKRNCRDAGGF